MTSNNTISNELFELFLPSFMRTSCSEIEKQKPQKGIRFQHIKDPYNLTGNKDTEDNAYPECSICYKHIYRNAKQCSNPCGALYHSTCFETTIETQQKNFNERDEDDEKELTIHCSYCRREVSMDWYELDRSMREMISLYKGGYDTYDAIKTIIKANGVIDENLYVEYFRLYSIKDTRAPKQPRKSLLGSKTPIKNTKSNHRNVQKTVKTKQNARRR